MAKEITTKFSIDLGTVVENSISAVKAMRRSEQARKEAEFQRAIANGLSYEEQLAMREKQLEQEKQSPFFDQEYITILEKSVADTKKLNRFNKYRTRYAETLGELSAGKINEQQYLNILKGQLSGIADPELRLEIQADITAAEAKVKTYNDAILGNQVKKAKFDGTKTVLNDVINKVNVARANALISDNQDEVTAYDETLSALKSQLAGVRIQDSLTDFQAKSATKGTSAVERLNFLNSEIQKADIDVPITIDGKSYSSVQQFWSLERDNYLAGKFFEQLDEEVKNNINTSVNRFGYPTQDMLDQTSKVFKDLRARPELAPFTNRLDITESSAMRGAVESFAKKVVDSAETSLEFEFADTQLKSVGQKYGIDTSLQRSQLFQRVRGLEQSQLIPSGSSERLAAKLEVDIPEIKTTTPAPTPTTPAKKETIETPAPVAPKPVTPETPAPKTEVPTEEPPQFTPATGVGTKSTDSKFTFTKEGWKPSASIPPATPAATPVPVTPTTPATYTGTSIVDYLKSQKQDSSFDSRAKLAKEKGISDYTGTPKQNEELLKLLRG